MELDDKFIRELIETFSSELYDQIQVISDGLLTLEKGLDDSDRQELINVLFRAAHNIKGAARGVDVLDVVAMSHRMESLFGAVKNGEILLEAEVINLCLETLDRMREAMEAFCNKCPITFDIDELLLRLDRISQSENNEILTSQKVSAKGSKDTPSVIPDTVSESDASAPDVISDLSQNQTISPSEHELLLSTPPPALTRATASENLQKDNNDNIPNENIPQLESGTSIRVSLDKLDQVNGLAEELQLVKNESADQIDQLHQLQSNVLELRNMLDRFTPLLRSSSQLPFNVRKLVEDVQEASLGLNTGARSILARQKSSSKHLNSLSTALQSEMQAMRLVPVNTLLRPLIRSVRDIAQNLGKEVDFTISGDSVEMDRAVLEGVKAPLVHLLRNAVDHGIETSEVRIAAGKSPTGKLSVSVEGRGSQILMLVSDDGAGIDPETIKASALRKQLLSTAELENMDQQEILDFIFRPGFSTKEIITDVSGRGVGLDVVRSNLRQLKGSVRVNSMIGKGSQFTMSLPLSLATERGLLIRSGGMNFAVPITAVERVITISPQDVVDVEASQAVVLDGRAIPLRDMAQALELSPHAPADLEQYPVIILSKGWDSVAFLVDDVKGERDIVVKRFRPPLVSVRNITGGTLSGAGEVIMVLNPIDLVTSALSMNAVSRVLEGENSTEVKQPLILVVDDSITTRTLEKGILEASGYKVEVAVDGREGWDVLQQHDFDLIVTDIEMPNMDGFDLTELIKQNSKYQNLPVIIVTSLARDADKQRGIDVGADAYIVKSQFETKALLDVVKQLV